MKYKNFKNLAYLFSFLAASSAYSVYADNVSEEYGIAIMLDDKCTNIAEKINENIAKNLPALKNVFNEPHVTIYQGAFSEQDIQIIKADIGKLNVKQSQIILSNFKVTKDRWLDWQVDKNQDLQMLHEKIVEIASPYHSRPLERSRDVFDSLNYEQKKQVDQFGVQNVMGFYNPHLTLFYAYPPSPDLWSAFKITQDEKYENIRCETKKIVIGKIGYNGNMMKIVETILLK